MMAKLHSFIQWCVPPSEQRKHWFVLKNKRVNLISLNFKDLLQGLRCFRTLKTWQLGHTCLQVLDSPCRHPAGSAQPPSVLEAEKSKLTRSVKSVILCVARHAGSRSS
ncbi:hypothetical protein GOODEAATRI_029049 [Goodea atripinnis]|uniref:Uncharacterized protein n=1 Tax=Goodea atripinnis TaxID=208336 RepID=A0ABV0PHX4_9TELE